MYLESTSRLLFDAGVFKHGIGGNIDCSVHFKKIEFSLLKVVLFGVTKDETTSDL